MPVPPISNSKSVKKPLRKRIPRASDAAPNNARRPEDDRAYTSNYGQERRPAPRKSYDTPEGEKRSFGPRPGEDRPYQKRTGNQPFNRERRDEGSGERRFGPRPGNDRKEGGEGRPFQPKSDRPFERREGGGGYNKEGGGDRKPFNRDAPREGGYRGHNRDDRKPFEGRRDFNRDGSGERKPFNRDAPREGGYNKEGGGERKPFNRDAPREGGYKGGNRNDRPYGGSGDKDQSERKPFNREAPREGGYNREGGGERKPFNRDAPREGGFKSGNRDDRKPYGTRDTGERKPYEGKKTFGAGGNGGNDRNGDRPPRKPFGGEDNRQERPAGGSSFGGSTGGSSRAGKRPPRAERAGNESEERRPRREDGERTSGYNRPARRREEEPAPQSAEESGAGMTLNKYLSRSGVCGRREAGEIIKRGDVKVNKEVMTNPGYRVQPEDVVVYEGKALKPQAAKVYVLLNKPRGFITTTDDEEDRRTVMDLVQGAAPERLYPVGRLDRNTTGVLLLTNDGDLAQRLTHPKYESKKIYQVTLDRTFEEADFKKLEAGIPLEDGDAKPDALFYLEEKHELGIEIHSGRNRIVRRMFEALEYKVEKLDRVMFAGLTKKNVPRGKWRILTEKEVILLKHFKQ